MFQGTLCPVFYFNIWLPSQYIRIKQCAETLLVATLYTQKKRKPQLGNPNGLLVTNAMQRQLAVFSENMVKRHKTILGRKERLSNKDGQSFRIKQGQTLHYRMLKI